MAKDPEPSPSVRRLIGQGKIKLDESRRKLDEVEGRPRQKMPSFEDLRKLEEKQAELEGEVDEISKVQDQPALSVAKGPEGWRFHARGWVAALVVIVAAALAGGWLLGRATAHHEHKEAPKSP